MPRRREAAPQLPPPRTRAGVAAWLTAWDAQHQAGITAAIQDPDHLQLATRIDAACQRRLSTAEAGDRIAPVAPPPL